MDDLDEVVVTAKGRAGHAVMECLDETFGSNQSMKVAVKVLDAIETEMAKSGWPNFWTAVNQQMEPVRKRNSYMYLGGVLE